MFHGHFTRGELKRIGKAICGRNYEVSVQQAEIILSTIKEKDAGLYKMLQQFSPHWRCRVALHGEVNYSSLYSQEAFFVTIYRSESGYIFVNL